ncbi:MAG TPA: glycosyltransferase [Thermoanaerobaculia bacterium]|nr:glycosyltransferase [Thermoanaerobaculia bacterium]
MSAADGLDIVVPVYGAAADLARCLASVIAHSELGRHRLIVVLDGPQELAVEEVLAPLAERVEGEAVVLRAPERRGFAAAANLRLATSNRDVVLLNSDTQVTARWLDKLQRAAASAAEVGTVTPFSNHATICSLPRFLEENTVPAGYDVDSFAALVERVAAPRWPRLPTGVGFCMLVRRRMLDAVGGLDEARFGLGYGEEVDLCLRGTAAGFVHLLDDATYVWHRGQGSFGGARGARVRRAERRMRRLHPGYVPAVADFIRRDPLAEMRARVLAALAPPQVADRRDLAPRDLAPRRVVHLVHGWPPFATAGTEVYAQGLARRQAQHRHVAAFARSARADRRTGDAIEHHDHGVRVRLLVNHFDQRDPLARNALDARTQRRAFARFLDEERPELLHVHHLAGHVATLVRVAARRGVPIVVQLQDWWPLCARVNLLHRDGYLCPGPTLSRCASCAPLTRRPPAAMWNRLLHALRRRWMREALAAADVLIAGSRFLADSYARLGWVPARKSIRVIPYGVETAGLAAVAASRKERTTRMPLRCGIIGSLMPHKGAHVAVGAFADIAPEEATLEVWGDPAADPDYARRLYALAGPAVRFRGRFPEGGTASVLGELDLLLMPSLGLESFGLVAREAHAAGVPVLASRRGALAELFADDWASERDGGAGGALVEPDDPRAIARWVHRLAAEPELLAAWRRTPPPKSMDEHAEEIEAVYAEVLRARGTSPGARE